MCGLTPAPCNIVKCPRVAESPVNLDRKHHATRNVPCVTNLLGVKGCGEAGNGASMPSVMNAILDALSVRDITEFDAPATPHRIWQALQKAATGA